MMNKIVFLGKSSVTFSTLERFFTRVNSEMTHKVALTSGLELTFSAMKGFLPCVSLDMSLQVSPLSSNVRAVAAREQNFKLLFYLT